MVRVLDVDYPAPNRAFPEETYVKIGPHLHHAVSHISKALFPMTYGSEWREGLYLNPNLHLLLSAMANYPPDVIREIVMNGLSYGKKECQSGD